MYMIQDKALEILKGTDNVFLTGQPGTGKTYLINKYIEWCLDNGIVPTITASTGIVDKTVVEMDKEFIRLGM